MVNFTEEDVLYGWTIYISTDYGNSWSIAYSGANNWNSVDISASGQYQIAGCSINNNKCIYISLNYGNTWTLSYFSSTFNDIPRIAMSASGQYITAVVNNGYIYTSVCEPGFWSYTNLGNTGLYYNGAAAINKTSITSNYTLDVSGSVIISGGITSSTGSFTYLNVNGNSKTFVIDHPYDETKYLVHACLEGPESGVYYRGEGIISDNISITIDLPYYVEKLATNFTVQVTQIYEDENSENTSVNLKCSRVKNGQFKVYGENCGFFWIVYGTRNTIPVEPLKSETDVKGSGPYKWI